MKLLKIISLFFCISFSLIHAHVLVFVHIGKTLPLFMEDAVFQASLFNSRENIYVIASAQSLAQPNKLEKFATVIKAEDLHPTQRHLSFLERFTLHTSMGDSFWFYTTERFFYLDDFMQQYNVSDLFHIENDNVLFIDLSELLPLFQKNYLGVAAVFDNDDRCIPSFIYVSDKGAMASMCDFIVKNADLELVDMEILALYKKMYPAQIANLPVIPTSYVDSYPLKSKSGLESQVAFDYSKNFDAFNSVFDAAAIGQYLFGTDPKNEPSASGFINESCLFNPANFKYELKIDDHGRLIPFLIFNGACYRINNIHVHSKNLKQILSKNFYDVDYKFSKDPIDVVIPCIKKDKRTLDLAVSGIKTNCANVRNVYIVSPENLSTEAIWVDEKSFPFTIRDIAIQMFNGDLVRADEYLNAKGHNGCGWIYQQLLKLYAPFVIPNISENVLILDADTVFLRPVEFQSSSGAALFNPSPEYYPPYFEHAQRVLPGFYKLFPMYSGVSHHMLFQRCVLNDLFNLIRSIHGVEPWIALVKKIDEKYFFGSGLSEYEIYFNFVFIRNSDVKIRPLKWAESGDLNKLQEYKNQGYDYVSFHSNYPRLAEFKHFGATDIN